MDTQSPQKIRFIYFLIFLAAMGGILYGYDLGIIAGALLFIHKSIPMSDMQSSFLVSSVLGGGAIATLIAGPLADLYGRRFMIILSACIFLAGIILLSFAQYYFEILTGRLIQGVGIGIITVTIPLYLAESLPKHIRGRGMSIFQLLLTAGIVLASLVGLYFTPTENWRAMFLSAGIPGCILLGGAFFLPNSPYWLHTKGLHAEALAVLRLSRSEIQAQKEFAALQNLHRAEEQLNLSGILANLCDKRFTFPLFIVFTIAALQQLTGINSILQFSAYILQKASLQSNLTAMLGNTSITMMNFIVTLLALLLIDQVGRKKLLTFGTGGMVIALVFLGIIYFYYATGILKGYLLLIGMLGFIFSYGIGPGVVIWLVLSELLPSRVRSSGMAIALFINSIVSSLFAAAFLSLTHYIGYSGVFWFCSLCSLIYFFIANNIIPETKNKSLEEIEMDMIALGKTHG